MLSRKAVVYLHFIIYLWLKVIFIQLMKTLICLDVEASTMLCIARVRAFNESCISSIIILCVIIFVLSIILLIFSKNTRPCLFAKINLTSGNNFHLRNILSNYPDVFLLRFQKNFILKFYLRAEVLHLFHLLVRILLFDLTKSLSRIASPNPAFSSYLFLIIFHKIKF